MANADKAIKGLECCIRMITSDVTCREIGCPYYSKEDQARLICWTDLNRDALNLIRKAYAQKGEITPRAKDKTHWYCGACGCRLPLKTKPKFCHKCGTKIGQWILSVEVDANENEPK